MLYKCNRHQCECVGVCVCARVFVGENVQVWVCEVFHVLVLLLSLLLSPNMHHTQSKSKREKERLREKI